MTKTEQPLTISVVSLLEESHNICNKKAPSDEGAGCTKCRLGERILPLSQKSNRFLTAPLTRGAFFLRKFILATLFAPFRTRCISSLAFVLCS